MWKDQGTEYAVCKAREDGTVRMRMAEVALKPLPLMAAALWEGHQ